MIEGAAKFYLACLGVAVLIFAMFPAEDTYISPTAILPVERVIETQVERVIETRVEEVASNLATVNVEMSVISDRMTDQTAYLQAQIDAAAKKATQASSEAQALRRNVAQQNTRIVTIGWVVTISLLSALLVVLIAAAVHRRRHMLEEKGGPLKPAV